MPFPHNTYCFIHIVCDNTLFIHHHSFSQTSLLSSLRSIYRISDPQTSGPLVIIIHAPSLSIYISFSSSYAHPASSFLPAYHFPSLCSFTLFFALLKLCRQEQKGAKLSQRSSHRLLVDFSFKFIFKQHLFILNRWKIHLGALQCKWMAPTSFSELLSLGWVCDCVGKCKFACVSLSHFQMQG